MAGTMSIDLPGLSIDYTHNNTEGKPETTGCLATREGRRVTAKGDVLKIMSHSDQ